MPKTVDQTKSGKSEAVATDLAQTVEQRRKQGAGARVDRMAKRFDVKDLDVAVTMTAGALIALGQLVQNQPDRDVEQTTDRVTEDLLRMFGMPTRTAHRICTLPLPVLQAGTAASA